MTPYLTPIRHIPRPRPMTDLIHYESITRALLSASPSVSHFTIDTTHPAHLIIHIHFIPTHHRPPATYTFHTTATPDDSLRQFQQMLTEVIPRPPHIPTSPH